MLDCIILWAFALNLSQSMFDSVLGYVMVVLHMSVHLLFYYFYRCASF